MAEPSKTEGEEPAEGTSTPATPAVPAETAKSAGKPLIGRTAAVGIGIGSAALVAALLYASRSKPDKKQS